MAERSSPVGVQKGAKKSASAPSGSVSSPPGTPRNKRLRRSQILRGYGSFSRVLTGGQSFSSPPLRLFLRPTTGPATQALVGFAVARSFRSAVTRNRVRRLMREAFRQNMTLWESASNIEAVWMYVGDPRAVARYDDVENAMRKLMKKVKPTAQ